MKLKFASVWERNLRRRWESGHGNQPAVERVANGIFVSLTTWKPRVGLLPLTLLTLISQSVRPEEICIWITQDDLAFVPSKLRDSCGNWNVVFRICDDLGPHKKWFSTRVFGDDATVVLADDDIFYPPNWLQSLITEAQVAESYLSHRCHEIGVRNGKIIPYGQWQKESRKYGTSSFGLFATSGAGVVFKPKWIQEPFYDESLIRQLSPTARWANSTLERIVQILPTCSIGWIMQVSRRVGECPLCVGSCRPGVQKAAVRRGFRPMTGNRSIAEAVASNFQRQLWSRAANGRRVRRQLLFTAVCGGEDSRHNSPHLLPSRH